MNIQHTDMFSEVSDRMQRIYRDTGKKITPDELSRALRELLRRQFLFREDHPAQVAILNKMKMEVRKSLLLFGYGVVFDGSSGMVGILPMEGMLPRNLMLEETAFLLCLRLIYENEGRAGENTVSNQVVTSFGEILDIHFTKTGRPPPRPQMLEDALLRFERSNVVRIVRIDKESRNDSVVSILPSIREVTGSDFLRRVAAFADVAQGKAVMELEKNEIEEDAVGDEAIAANENEENGEA